MHPHLCPLTLALLASGCLTQRIDDYLDGSHGADTSTGTSSDESSSSSSSGDSSSSGGTTQGTSAGEAEAEASADSTETGTSTDTTTTSTTTTGDPPFCGDGVVAGAEECDDGNDVPTDGCSNECAADIRVFVSSELYKAGELMGVELADAECIQRAYDADLPDALRFRAWLSTSTQDAKDRFDTARRGRLVMVNGLVLAGSWPELLAGALANPLEVTNFSETYHGKVWTGTKSDGTAADSAHCLDWTSNSLIESAYYGYSDEISHEWTLADQIDNPLPCSDPLAIYCFESF